VAAQAAAGCAAALINVSWCLSALGSNVSEQRCYVRQRCVQFVGCQQPRCCAQVRVHLMPDSDALCGYSPALSVCGRHWIVCIQWALHATPTVQ
jgi:hypothetical protein